MASGEPLSTEATPVGKYEEPRSAQELLRFRHPARPEAPRHGPRHAEARCHRACAAPGKVGDLNHL
jgi:hypothetical protein